MTAEPTPAPADPPVARFGPYELRPADRLLLRDGEPVVLRARAFDLLTVLAERPGRLVTKAELLDRVWPGLVVEENNIAAQVAALRKVVGGERIVTVPGSGYRFVGDAAAPATPSAAAAPTGTPVPAPGPVLYGRDADLRAVLEALGRDGLVTLTGPGGVGKTALARAAAALGGRPSAWVDLSVLHDAAELRGAACRALGVATPPLPAAADAALVAALQGGSSLLVLDNAEHLVEAVAALCATLCAATGTRVLVTSQLALRVPGEHVHALEPLALSASDAADESASVQMLTARIRAADARYAFDASAPGLLRELCARLDGLPLAIEMAAARVPLLGLRGTLAALDQRFATLKRGAREAPARHRTLRAALEWSHALLTPPQQQALRRLGVYAGSFSLDLAVAVTAGPGEAHWDAVDTFAELVERSLVASLHVDPPRYRLLETVRQFALEALAAAGDEDAATRSRAVRALTQVLAAAADAPVAAATAELANVPEALAWSLRHDPEAGVALALAAAAAATWTPWLGEAAHWIDACEPVVERVPRPVQARWWRELARFQTFVRGTRTVEAARQAAALERELGNAEGLFWSLVPMLRSRQLDAAEFAACRDEAQRLLDAHPGWPPRSRIVFAGSLALDARSRGDFDAALVHQRAEAEQARAAGLDALARNAESNLASTLNGLGRFEEALALLDRLATVEHADDPVRANDLVQRLTALMGLGRLDEAEALAPAALADGRRFGLPDAIQVLVLLRAQRGDVHAAAQVLGRYRAMLADRGAVLPTDRHAPWRAAQALLERALGRDTVAELADRGRALADAEADRLLLGRHDR